ncbi:LHX9 [Bugula neritina]|uniref:LHX9 n=1 Tax=Bugula neritina TaxID=10212 RepID=A0A7J7KCU5_BUGNE|nr:LHX9 [Bugula neritina]
MVEYSEPTIVSSDTPNPLRDSILSANTNYRLSSVTPISSNTGTNHISSQNLVSPDTQNFFSSPLLSMIDDRGCAGCGEDISEKYFLFALDRKWHDSCLKCYICSKLLETEGSCYVKDSRIYCKKDYFLKFGMQKCCRCHEPIQSGEMVMRAQSNVFHVQCFTCHVCNCRLHTGDHFGVCDDKIFCRLDFEQLQYEALHSPVTLETVNRNPNIALSAIPDSLNSISTNLAVSQCISELTPAIPLDSNLSSNNTQYDDSGFVDYATRLPHITYPLGSSAETQSTATKPQKSKKRRQLNSSFNSTTGNDESTWPHIGMTMLDTDSLGTTGYHQSLSSTANHTHLQQVKQKRMRTSFKHHQLNVMKAYFTANHNPDAKDLKQLSQKTGLSKRVLQVWFQNARAKFRRGQSDICGESRGDDSVNGDGGMDQSILNDEDATLTMTSPVTPSHKMTKSCYGYSFYSNTRHPFSIIQHINGVIIFAVVDTANQKLHCGSYGSP